MFCLCFYETKQIKKMRKRKTDIKSVKIFVNVFRFIDDLTVLNDGGQFRRRSKDFFPPWLKLKQKRDINAKKYF